MLHHHHLAIRVNWVGFRGRERYYSFDEVVVGGTYGGNGVSYATSLMRHRRFHESCRCPGT